MYSKRYEWNLFSWEILHKLLDPQAIQNVISRFCPLKTVEVCRSLRKQADHEFSLFARVKRWRNNDITVKSCLIKRKWGQSGRESCKKRKRKRKAKECERRLLKNEYLESRVITTTFARKAPKREKPTGPHPTLIGEKPIGAGLSVCSEATELPTFHADLTRVYKTQSSCGLLSGRKSAITIFLNFYDLKVKHIRENGVLHLAGAFFTWNPINSFSRCLSARLCANETH